MGTPCGYVTFGRAADGANAQIEQIRCFLGTETECTVQYSIPPSQMGIVLNQRCEGAMRNENTQTFGPRVPWLYSTITALQIAVGAVAFIPPFDAKAAAIRLVNSLPPPRT